MSTSSLCRVSVEAGDFCSLMGAIQTACKIISRAVHRAGVDDLRGDVFGGTVENSTGDIVKRASEETDHLIVPPPELTGQFCVTFDPLDGSSNIDAGVNVGTIFGVYRRVSNSGPTGRDPGDINDILQPPRNLIAAGYTMYGASTMLVLATDGEVNGFTLDMSIGEFILTHPRMTVPQRGKMYSINEGNCEIWDDATSKYVTYCKSSSEGHKPYTLRYIGTMVGDVHRTLCYGGIFMYPADRRSPSGKLRLLYECGPLSFVCRAAGGRASTGTGEIQDIQPVHLHQRCSILLGSKLDVEDAESFYTL